MIVPEPTLTCLSEIISQFLYPEKFTGLLLDGFGLSPPNNFETVSNTSQDVARMLRIIDE